MHTLREPSPVSEKAIFPFSFPSPPFSLLGLNFFQKKFLVYKLVLTRPRGFIWYVETILKVIFSQFLQWGGDLKLWIFSQYKVIVFSNTGCVKIWVRTDKNYSNYIYMCHFLIKRVFKKPFFYQKRGSIFEILKIQKRYLKIIRKCRLCLNLMSLE